MSRVLEDVVVSVLDVLKFDHKGIFEAILDVPDWVSHKYEPIGCDGGSLTLIPSGELSLPPVKDLI